MLMHERVRTVRLMNAVAAGTSNQNSTSVDMSVNGGYRGIRFKALFGALTAGQVTYVKAQGSTDNSSFSDLAGSNTGALADADSNNMVVVDLYKPIHRYNRVVIVRGTQNAVIDGVTAEMYEPITEKTTQSSSVTLSKQLISPAAGTA